MSEHTFYAPSAGVWVAIDDVPAAILKTYPAETREIEPCPGKNYTFDGTSWVYVAPAINLAELFETARVLVNNYVDQVARERNYNDAVACASYKDSTNAKWSSEASRFIAWRDSVWAQIYDLQAKAQSGELTTFPSADELIKTLPKIDWGD